MRIDMCVGMYTAWIGPSALLGPVHPRLQKKKRVLQECVAADKIVRMNMCMYGHPRNRHAVGDAEIDRDILVMAEIDRDILVMTEIDRDILIMAEIDRDMLVMAEIGRDNGMVPSTSCRRIAHRSTRRRHRRLSPAHSSGLRSDMRVCPRSHRRAITYMP